jgi:hypothetical protein
MRRFSDAELDELEYPDETLGSVAAREIREECNKAQGARASEFNPNRMIADLQQLAKDWKKGDFHTYRVTSILAEKAPTRSLGMNK